MVTCVSTGNLPPAGSKLESLIRIDMSTLSQSELLALSLSSDSASDLCRADDVVIPQINWTPLKESAGTGRQIHSRFRLAPRPPDSLVGAGHRSRIPGFLSHPRPSPAPANCDHERTEDKLIVNFLKQLVNGKDIQDSLAVQLVPRSPKSGIEVVLETGIADTQVGSSSQDKEIVLFCREGKRKRERKAKPKVAQNGGDVQLDILNKNGIAVDLATLEKADGLYEAELRRRTHGLQSEKELLGFLRSLEGQWGSRRKRRRIVIACELGDALPVGWKLLMGLRRREGRMSIYIRRYIR